MWIEVDGVTKEVYGKTGGEPNVILNSYRGQAKPKYRRTKNRSILLFRHETDTNKVQCELNPGIEVDNGALADDDVVYIKTINASTESNYDEAMKLRMKAKRREANPDRTRKRKSTCWGGKKKKKKNTWQEERNINAEKSRMDAAIGARIMANPELQTSEYMTSL